MLVILNMLVRRKPLLLLFTSLCIAFASIAQTICLPAFIKEYGGNGQVKPHAIVSLPDGSLIVSGTGTASGGSSYDGLVMKLSNKGTVIWSFLAGGAGDDAFTGALPLADGSLLLYGSTSSFGYSEGKAWLVRISAAGALLWSRQVGTSAGGTGSIKAAKQLADGDIVGTYNAGDSTTGSDAVVFRMSLAGNLKWTHLFDNGDNDSFTSIALQGDTIYAGGFYTAATKYGAIVKINSKDGSLLSSVRLRKDGDNYKNEITGLEVYGGIVSYGLWLTENGGSHNGIALIQTDLQGNRLFERYGEDFGDTAYMHVKRTSDNSFLILRSDIYQSGSSTLIKINNFSSSTWGNVLGMYGQKQLNYALDITPDGGCITAGYHGDDHYFPVVMNIMKMADNGETGVCRTATVGMTFTMLTSVDEAPFTWLAQRVTTNASDEPITPAITSSVKTENTLCDTSFCVDKSPLPPGCGKTYRIEYGSNEATLMRDAVTTDNGEKIIIGDFSGAGGMIVKTKTNGDVAWAKTYEEFSSGSKFIRILQSNDGNWLIFGIRYYTEDNEAKGGFVILKIDTDGNVIWTKHGGRYYVPEVTDVVATPDNGFVVMLTDAYGLGYTFSYVIRYDANANIIWKKELTHFVAVPLYRSITCNSNAVFLAYDSYDYYSSNRFGVDKLDFATGNQLWSKRFTTGTDNIERINRICEINDTAYLFVNNLTPLNAFMNVLNTTLVTLDGKGSIIKSLSLQCDPFVPVTSGWWWDEFPPTVTLTPDLDFVLTGRSVAGTADTALQITRFKRDGTPLWSHRFSAMKSYAPRNIHPQGSGFLIMGASNLTGFPYRNSFLLKVDSNGIVLPGASGECRPADRPFTASDTHISVTDPAIDSVIDLKDWITSDGNMLSQAIDLDATQFCGVQGNCGTVLFKQKGNGCSLQDTLVYYLQDAASCDAAATWQFDASYFRAGMQNGDSVELMPLRTGSSVITAKIEGNCSFTEQQITAAVLVSATGVNLGADTSLCNGNSLVLHAGTAYTTYAWNDKSTDSLLTINEPGKYFVTVTDNCRGTGSDTIIIKPSGTFISLTEDTAFCKGDTVRLTAGSGYLNYRWSPPYYLNSKSNTAQVNPAVTTKYFVSADKNDGCTVSDSVVVSVLSAPAILLRPDTSVCEGDSVLLDAGPSFTRYTWNTGNSSQYIQVKEKGSYIVTGTFSNGCLSKDTFLLNGLYSKPAVSLDKDPVLCAGYEKVLQPADTSPGNQYLWSNGSHESAITITDIGLYWVSVTSGQGCQAADTAVLTGIRPLPSGFLPADSVICQYDKLTISSLLPYQSYLWDNRTTGSSIVVSQPGFYTLQVTDAHGCAGTDTMLVTQKQCRQGVYIPSAFTPNRDGHDDLFKPMVYGYATGYRFVIFDRFGKKVFETHDPTLGWDGSRAGIPSDTGTYIWQCMYSLPGEAPHSEKGTVVLVR